MTTAPSKPKPLSIVDLINKAGVDKVKVQFLSRCMAGFNTNKKGDSKVTFVTTQINATDVALNTGDVGVVLWIPRTDFTRAWHASDGGAA